ncbi:hypothetical protein AgCh_012086 [Apium graveolens]
MVEGYQEPIKNMTEPKGDLGWSILDMQTYKGWLMLGSPYPYDTLKAFQIPDDAEYYGSLGVVVMATLIGLATHGKEVQAEQRKREKAEFDGTVATSQLKLAQDSTKLWNENEELKARKPVEGYVESAKRFLKAKYYAHPVTQKAARLYEKGFNDFGTFLGVSNVYDPQVHTYEAYVHAELEKGENAEGGPEVEEETGPGAPAEDEILLSKLGIDVVEEAEGDAQPVFVIDFSCLKDEITPGVLAGLDSFSKVEVGPQSLLVGQFVEVDEPEGGLADFDQIDGLSSITEFKGGFPCCFLGSGSIRPYDPREFFHPLAFGFGEALLYSPLKALIGDFDLSVQLGVCHR